MKDHLSFIVIINLISKFISFSTETVGLLFNNKIVKKKNIRKIMKNFLILFLFVVLFATTIVFSEKLRFDNYRLYRANIETETQLDSIRNLENSGYQLWNTARLGSTVDILVPPHKFAEFTDISEHFKIEISVKNYNIQELIDNEQPLVRPRAFGWDAYFTWSEIYAWLDSLVTSNPDVLTSSILGLSTEQRQIRLYKLSYKEGNPGIIIESVIHAREWITVATSTYILQQLLTSEDPIVRTMAENIDWYFIPILNIDGYHYTHTTNRLWRKTRAPHFTICYGVDLNRNFGYQWSVIGASNNPCSETYHGPVAFSDPESQIIRNFFEEDITRFNAYIAYHAYGQYILSPFGYTTEHVDNHDDLVQIGEAGAAAVLANNGTDYIVGSTAEKLYFNSGSSRDWVRGEHNLPISYTIELRDHRDGNYGFVLPADQILPNCIEIFAGLQAMVNEMRNLGYLESPPSTN